MVFRKTLWPFPLLTLAILSLFWPALLNPFLILHPTFSPYSDTMVIHWPKAQLMAQSWQGGEGLPHWTPLILSGMPLAANQLAMLSYPPAWLFLILPIEPIFNFLFIFHLLVGGLGIFFLLRECHRCSATAALLGGLTFALNGKWLAHAAGGHVSMVGAIAWLPWVLFGLMKLMTAPWPRSRLKWTILTAMALALQVTTHTLPVIYSVYLSGAVVAWHFVFIRPHHRLNAIKQLWLLLLSIPGLAGLLGAAQLLPLLELSQFSNRALSLNEAAEYALSPAQLLVGLFLPSAAGAHEYVVYLGLIPLLLAPFGLARKKRWTWFYGLLFIFTILFALGPYTPVHRLFYYFTPGFGWVRTPARMFFVGAMALAALVGFAIDHLQQARWSTRASQWLTRLVVALGTFALLTGLGLAFGGEQIRRSALALAIFAPLGLGLILFRARRVISAQRAVVLLGLLLFLDLAWFDASLMRFAPLEEALAPGRAAAQYLAQKPGLFRVYSPSYSLPSQTAAAAGLHLADGVEPVHLAIYDQYMARAGGYHDPSFSVTIPNFGGGNPALALQHTKPNLKLLGMLNVTYLASAFPMDRPGLTLETDIEGTFIYRNKYTLPRAWVTHQVLPAQTNWLTQLENLPNLADVAIIEAYTLAVGDRGTAVSRPPSVATITHYSADQIELKTEIPAPGWLVLSEIWYPGWQARVNGSPQPVEKVNGLLRGVYLSEPGTYQISMTYHPRSVVWGNWLAGITTAVIILTGMLASGHFSYSRLRPNVVVLKYHHIFKHVK
ncbi:MAG: hypothetical protein JW953_21220 [Anaerolineae bacterium]|nr:hypothetical protein [Anaerolineae bacterium]